MNTQKVNVTEFAKNKEKPAEVIYKVQANDAKKIQQAVSSSNPFLKSLKPTQQNTVTNLTSPMTTIKRIKLSADQLTKIKSSSTLDNKIVKVEPETTISSTELTAKVEETMESEMNDSLIYSVDRLMRLNGSKSPVSFELTLKKILPSCPLIDRQKRSTSELSAASVREYYSWPYAKRKAREWMRAVQLRQMCAAQGLTGLWSTKQIVIWLRAHGYTPLEYRNIKLAHIDDTSVVTAADTSGTDTENYDYVNSFTPINRLFAYKRLPITCYDEIDIDVVAEDESGQSTRRLEEELKRDAIEKERNKNSPFNIIELNEVEKFIQEQLFTVISDYFFVF